MTGIFYKHYEGNSFYVAGGLTYLNPYEEQDWDIFDLNDLDKFTSIGADNRIGNQWHWKNFTLGCDWIGIGKRFVKFTKEDNYDSDTTATLLT